MKGLHCGGAKQPGKWEKQPQPGCPGSPRLLVHQDLQELACTLLCHHAATMPGGRSALPRRWKRRSPRGYWQSCQLNLLLQNRNEAKKKKKKAAVRINLQKKSANEREKGSK